MFSNETHVGSKSVVETARNAREERAKQKKMDVAIVKIQAIARGFLSRQKVLHQWLEEIDSSIGYEEEKKQEKKQSKGTAHDTKMPEPSSSSSDWQFKPFSSNILTGTYSAMSMMRNETEKQINQLEVTNSKTDLSDDKNAKEVEKDPNVKPRNKLEKPSGSVIYGVVNKFLFLTNFERDKWRFDRLCKTIMTNCLSEQNVKLTYCSLCVIKKYAMGWIIQVKKLLKTCLKYMDVLNPQEYHASSLINVCLNMLVTFTDAATWRIAKKQPELLPILTQISNSISHDLLSSGSLHTLGSLLSRRLSSTQQLSSDSMTLAAFTMALRPVISSKMKEENVIAFTKHILSVPAMIWHVNVISSQRITLCKQHGLFERIVDLLHGEGKCQSWGIFDKGHGSPDTVINILCTLANMTQLAVTDKEILEKKYVSFVLFMNQLLDYIVQYSQHQSSSTSTWHPILGFFSSSKKTQNHTMKYVKLQLEYLWNPTLLRAVYRDVLTLESLHPADVTPTQAEQLVNKPISKSKASDRVTSYLRKLGLSKSRVALKQTGGRKLEYAEVKNTMLTCLMFKKCLSIVTKQLQLKILTGLTFMDEVLCRLWRFICELGTSGGLKLFLSALKLPPEVAEPYFAVFTLFCEMAAHILSILDDVEFYEEQIPFHLEELVTISEFLKTFVFRMIWDKKPDNSNHMAGVLESAMTLLLMLYDRDSRRPFTPKDHWLCRELKPSAIKSQLDRSTSRGAEILDKIPFVIPHKERVVIFRSLIHEERQKMENEYPAHITVKRSRLLEDGFEQLSKLSSRALKGTIRVKFINDLGLDEAGIDQDGVFKEFLEEIIKKVFNPDMNLFRITTEEDGKLYPSPTSYLQDDHLHLLKFVGQILGKAVYDGMLVDVPFATFFLRNLQQQHSMLYSPLDELPSLDAEFYKNLTWIKRYEGDIGDLDLTFTYEEDILGQIETRELVPGGSTIPVTNQNRITYIHKLAHYRLHTQIREQTQAFTSGFRSIINKQWTSMFSAPELQRLISGDNVDLDLKDLKSHVTYYGGFHSSHKVIRWLWDILEKDYNPQQRAGFLKFVTSCSRPPILGFTYLQPQFSIRCVEVSEDDDAGDSLGSVVRGFFRLSSTSRSRSQKHRLPTASTCFNLLKLPNYPSKDILRDKLKQAIANNTGFELS